MLRIVAILMAAFFLFSCNGGETKQTQEANHDKQKSEANEQLGQIAILTDSLRMDSTNADLYNKRALEYLKKRKMARALRDVNEALELAPDEPEFLITLSDVYFALSQPQKTRQTLLKTLDLDPGNTNAMLKLAELNLYFRDYMGVNSYADRAIATDPGFAQAYFIKAFAAKEQGDTLEAIRQFQTAVDKDPRHYEALIQLGVLYSAQNNPLAVDYYKRALELDPKSIEALYNLGMYYQGNEMYNEAIKAYNDIITIDPAFKMSYYNLGYIHLAYLGVYQEAVKYFTRAIEADPSYFQAYYNRGYARELMGDVMNARSDYERALEIRPNYNPAISGLNRLDQLGRPE